MGEREGPHAASSGVALLLLFFLQGNAMQTLRVLDTSPYFLVLAISRVPT